MPFQINMNENILKKYQSWIQKIDSDDPMYAELMSIKGNEKEITDRFYQDITFGTAGLRGISGAGTNRMNRLTVGRATQGIAEYIKESGQTDARKRGVVIAYDCRHHSREYAELAAGILMAGNIHVWLFEDPHPTPELSYAIQKLHAVSGINMTASHNPPEYNGYKVYWEDGAQISGNVADGMIQKIEARDLFEKVSCIALNDPACEKLLTRLDEDMDQEYLQYVLSMRQRPDSELDLSVSAVYTPLNGAGSIPMQAVMQKRGFQNFYIVEEQKNPDPDFTTVPYPNPEDPSAFALAEQLGRKNDASVLIATDPDADRMAVEIRDRQGNYRFLNGNQTGAMLIYYMARSMKESGRLPEKSFMVKSIVTGNFGRTICEDYGITVCEALTGFKNICGRIPEMEDKGYQYFFAYEESIGCAPSDTVRDKDGITAAMLIMEMAAWYQKQHMSLADALEMLYQKYGYFSEDQVSLVLKGEEGKRQIEKIMSIFREQTPDGFAGMRIQSVIDYKNGFQDIPAQNAMKFIMEDKSWFAMRPSGTEPKLKFYFYTRKNTRQESENTLKKIRDAVISFARSI